MNVTVIGTGYVGLVAGACFAHGGHDVICVDNNEEKVTQLKRGEIPIFEPGLDVLVTENVQNGRLTFSTDSAQAVKNSEVIFIAVGTPQDNDGSADLSQVLTVSEMIGKAMNGPKIVVTKSTVPVGTARKVADVLKGVTKFSFDVVSNPEFLREGSAIEDFTKPDRVVIGTNSPVAAEVMKELYRPFVENDDQIFVMDNASAEITKYAANAMLATKISFMNEISHLCEAVGADVNDVRKGVGSDFRIGHSFLYPGVGYGGSCFPKDVKALVKRAADVDIDLHIVRAVDKVNNRQKEILVDKACEYYESREALKGKRFAVWGLAFKPLTDDMREAPSITIINQLLDAGASVCAYDPESMKVAKRVFGEKIDYAPSSYEALKDADALFIVTEWKEFQKPNFRWIHQLLREPVVFDGRNLFEPDSMSRLGFTYYSIGRSPIVRGEKIVRSI
jgi:UDPglucose 6-dehydrogenase